MAEKLTWREKAKAFYRVIFGQLSDLPEPTTMWGIYLIDELRDALFDLERGRGLCAPCDLGDQRSFRCDMGIDWTVMKQRGLLTISASYRILSFLNKSRGLKEADIARKGKCSA